MGERNPRVKWFNVVTQRATLVWSIFSRGLHSYCLLIGPPERSSYYVLCLARVRKSPVRVWEEWRLELRMERVRLRRSSLWPCAEASSALSGLSSSSSSSPSSEVVCFSLLQWDPANGPQDAHSAFTAQMQASQSIYLSKNTVSKVTLLECSGKRDTWGTRKLQGLPGIQEQGHGSCCA